MHGSWSNGLNHMNRFNGEGFNGMVDFWNNSSGWLMVYDLAKFLIFILAVLFVVRMLVKNFGHQKESDQPSPSNRAIQLLKERYAAGEIDEAEYKKKIKRLNEE